MQIFKLSTLALFLAVISFTGCQTYNDQSADVSVAWKSGDYGSAAEKIKSKVSGAPERDKLLWLMEEGAILQMAGDPLGSIESFDSAEAIINQFEEQAKVKLGSEAAAILSNQATLPYRGYAYDKIMVNTFKSMNFANQGDLAAARVEINRAYQRQRDAVAENQKQIEKAEAEAQAAKRGEIGDGKRKESYDVDRAKSDPNVAGATAGILAEIDDRSLPYANYVNPFSVFWEGIYFSYAGTGTSDYERALMAFERLRAMSPSKYIDADFKMASNLANGIQPEPTTYVILATGSAPTREEFKVEVPLFVVSTVSYVAASFPRLRYEEDFIPDLALTSGNPSELSTALLADMDSIVSLEFKNDWPIVLTKTLISTGVKATIGYMAEKAVENEDWKIKFAAKVANVALQSAANRADLRTWTTLPKRFSYLRTSTPETGIVSVVFGQWAKEIVVEPGRTNFIYIRTPNSNATPTITQFSI